MSDPNQPDAYPPGGSQGSSPDPYAAPSNPYAQGQQAGPYGGDQQQGQPDGQGQQASPYSGQYGQPYGQQPGQEGQYGGSDSRPGTVTAGAVIAMVCSALALLLFGFLAFAVALARDQVVRELEKSPQLREMAGISAGDIANGLLLVSALVALWSLVALVLAVLTLRRSNAARIGLVVSAVASALFSLLSITSGLSAITLIASIATIVLLFTGGAGEWFARRHRSA